MGECEEPYLPFVLHGREILKGYARDIGDIGGYEGENAGGNEGDKSCKKGQRVRYFIHA